MAIVEWTLVALVIICIVAVFIKPVCDFLETHTVYGGDDYGRMRQEFIDQGKAEGFTYQDMMQHHYLREMMARFRREASDAVRANPENWREEIDKVQQKIFNAIAMENPDLLPAFGGMIKGLSYGHILYPSEARMVDSVLVSGSFYGPNEDRRAALHIVRPG